jgi:hypothetical protein
MTEHEKYISEVICKKPVFLTDYPKEIKSFYMKQNPDGKTVAATDLLVPGVGEIIGCSEREADLDKLLEAMEAGRILVYPKAGKGVRWGESVIQCHRCKCEVSDEVSNPEYRYYCPECDEDLYSFEVDVKIVEVN